jgi:hypothetical protein
MEEEEAGERGKGEGSRRNGQRGSAKVRGLTWLDFGDATFPLFSARPVPASGSNMCVFSYVYESDIHTKHPYSPPRTN